MSTSRSDVLRFLAAHRLPEVPHEHPVVGHLMQLRPPEEGDPRWLSAVRALDPILAAEHLPARAREHRHAAEAVRHARGLLVAAAWADVAARDLSVRAVARRAGLDRRQITAALHEPTRPLAWHPHPDETDGAPGLRV